MAVYGDISNTYYIDEIDILVEGANIDITKDLIKFKREYDQHCKACKKAIKDKNKNEAKKEIKVLIKLVSDLDKMVSNMKSDVGSDIFAAFIGVMIFLIKSYCMLLPGFGIHVTIVMIKDILSGGKDVANNVYSTLAKDHKKLIDLSPLIIIIQIANVSMNIKKSLDEGDTPANAFNLYRMQIKSLISKYKTCVYWMDKKVNEIEGDK